MAVLAALGLVAWRVELFDVGPRMAPQPLAALSRDARPAARVDVVLPQVPAGLAHLTSGGPLLIHYWAPWEEGGRAQAVALDSLRRAPGMEDLADMKVLLVCFDPFPSVARYVARARLRLAVLLDPGHALRGALPCPRLPYTYVLDRDGRVAVAQAGPVDWLAPRTRTTLHQVLAHPGRRDVIF